MRKLKTLIGALQPTCSVGAGIDGEVQATLLTADSRAVRPGAVFVAVKGGHHDGHAFIAEAMGNGASMIVAQNSSLESMQLPPGCESILVIVENSRAALAELAAAWHGYPAREMVVVGVTGTNGKTTCTWLLERILVEAGFAPGVIGTVSYRYTKGRQVVVLQEAPLTTPEPLTLQQTMRTMIDNGVTHLLMEVSSHALHQQRLGSLQFHVAAFTNLSRDHLDYHTDLGAYFVAKQRLFTDHLRPDGVAVIVKDAEEGGQEWGGKLIAALGDHTVYQCGLGRECGVRADAIEQDRQGTRCKLIIMGQDVRVVSRLTGRFNVFNMLVAAGVSHAVGISPQVIAAGLAALDGVPGRMEQVSLGQSATYDQPTVIVDYAHTPDALDNVLKAVRPLCRGRLVCVFGCGGDRDRGKRAEMGGVAARRADLTVVTSDNPRTEEPLAILEDIVPGVERESVRQVAPYSLFSEEDTRAYTVIADRRQAITLACSHATGKDWVVIAGKGHETYQLVGRQRLHFDDRQEAMEGLIAWSPRHLLTATGGRIVSGQATVPLAGVSTDTRNIGPGDIFLALRGDRVDGHAYLAAAVEKGAGALIVDRDVASIEEKVLVLRVDDTLAALGDLARYRRQLLGKRLLVTAVTGSSGKTTVKEMVAAIFVHQWKAENDQASKVLKTKGNFNNLVGLPLSLLPVTPFQQAAILEMGMNSFGEIARLTEIADPDVGCINNIQPAHLLGLGSIEGVAQAKGELFAGMRPDAVRVVNYDDPFIRRMARDGWKNSVGFATSPTGRRYKPMVQVTRSYSLGQEGTRFSLHIGGEKARVWLKVPGQHNVSNAAAAAAIATAAGVTLEKVVRGLEEYSAVDKRMAVTVLPGGLQVLNDTYNANPASMEAALRTVAAFRQVGKRIAVLGDMLELGSSATAAHQRIGRIAAELDFHLLAVTGEHADAVRSGALEAGLAEGDVHIFHGPQAIASWLYQLIANGVVTGGDWLLVKGSRGMRMETVIESLQRQLQPNRERHAV